MSNRAVRVREHNLHLSAWYYAELVAKDEAGGVDKMILLELEAACRTHGGARWKELYDQCIKHGFLVVDGHVPVALASFDQVVAAA